MKDLTRAAWLTSNSRSGNCVFSFRLVLPEFSRTTEVEDRVRSFPPKLIASGKPLVDEGHQPLRRSAICSWRVISRPTWAAVRVSRGACEPACTFTMYVLCVVEPPPRTYPRRAHRSSRVAAA